MISRHFNSYFYGSESSRRVVLFSRAFYAILSLDCWVLMLSHGARYGADGFNVPHFSWLRSLPWQVTPSLYVGVMIFSGWLALFCALLPQRTIARVGVCLLYSYGWAMSMLDSYQHHYFLSLVLVCLCFLPREVFLRGPTVATLSVWPFRLMTATVGLVYLFAALSKLEPGWYDGQVLAHVVHPSDIIGLAWLQTHLGAQLWPVMAHTVIVIECLIALAYLLLPWLSVAARLISFALCVLLHVGIDAIGLHIGWFSYYMLLISACSFAPSRWFEVRRRRFAWSLFARRHVVAFMSVACALGIWIVAGKAQLPGIGTASVGYAAFLIVLTVFDVVRDKLEAASSVSAAGLFGTVSLGLVLSLSDVRFDYYRFAGRDAERQARLHVALTLYQKAEAFAPAGKSRSHKIRALKRMLATD